MPRSGWLLVAGLLLAARPARGAETQWWVADQPPDYARSESRGVIVDPDGALELGPAAVVTRAESLSVIWSLAVLRDGSVAAGGDHGRILRWSESGGFRLWARLPVGQVLALAADGDGIVAGTGPEGLVYRVGARGDTALLARTGERYVWGLVRAGGGAWYAATGTRGRLLRIEGGKVRIVADTDESNLSSIVADGKGGVFVGGDSRGRVIHAGADGRLRTVFDAAEDEIRALALGPDGALYAAGLSASAVSDDSGEHDGAEEPAPAKAAVTGGHATVYRIVPDSVATSYWTSPQPFVFALAGTPRGLVAATGNRAGVYLLARANGASQWLAAPQGQVTALAATGSPGETRSESGVVFAATSNPGALWRLGPARARRGELLSAVQDAKRIARFGHILWRGELRGAEIELHTRSGNNENADTTWSEWRGGAARGGDLAPGSPPGRYFQWKLELAGGEPRIESVEAAWREENLPPRIEEVNVAPQGQGFREGELQPRLEPVTQTLPSGQRVEYSLPPSQSARALRELPAWARGLRTIQWKASDPNGDPLRYRVEARAEGGGGDWFKVEERLETTVLTWDTSALPDGRYRVRVIGSDAEANPLGEGRTDEAESAPFTVDNTAPEVTALSARREKDAVLVEGSAEDAASALSRIEVAIDDREWRMLTPDGGFADQRRLSFRGRLSEVEPGEHTVSVRAVDAAGNPALRVTRVTVPKPR